ncbi:MAG: arylsulfatase [Chloroflexota bacterium]
MAGVREYPEGTPFPGRAGRLIGESDAAWPSAPRARSGAPNVMIILLDDVGFAQFGCFGGAIETPNLDRLARGGLRYRDFHTTALCTPTRACMMTGRNHHATGAGVITAMALGYPGYNNVIPPSNAFLPEMLLPHGYSTYALGKWHLTPITECNTAAPRARWPLSRGFERFYGFLGGFTSQWVPDLVEDNRFVDPPASPEQGYHLNEDMANKAIGLIRDLKATSGDKPFFMYYCPGAGHTPHHVPQDWVERYRGRFDQGWDRLREEIFARQVADGIVPPGTVLSPRPDWVAAWDSLSGDEQRLFARQMEVYAAFISHTDHHIGRVIDFLEEIGELDNTLIFVTSDNGASAEGGVHGEANHMLRHNRFTETLTANLAAFDRWGDPSTHPHYSWGWAWAGCTPLRRWKAYVHQGGVTDPLIVHWPDGIAARGEVRQQYAHVSDIVPTVLEALGIEQPTHVAGRAVEAIQGVSFAHTFNDAAAATRKSTQYYEMFASRAIWHRGWKAVAEQPRPMPLTEERLREQRWELYNLDEDFSECNDLAQTHPARLRELVDLWWAEAGRNNVLPLDGRREQRLTDPKPTIARTRDRFVFYPDTAPLNHFSAPNIHNRSHTISADVMIPASGAEGVLLAQGSVFAGYSLFVQDGRLQYVHNYLGLREHWVRASEPLSAGEHTLGFAFEKTGEHQGIGRLYVDGQQVAEGEIPETVPIMFDRNAEGLCCGYDSGLPVTRSYVAPFRFTGTIKRVSMHLDGVARIDPEAEHRAAMHAQ